MSKGFIYIISNEAMPNYYKIGKTERDVKKRIDELFWTNVPVPFDIVYACEVNDMDTIEKHIHSVFSDKRINKNREFFEIDPDKVIEVLERDKDFIRNITDSLQEEELSENITQEDIQASEEIKRKRRPNFTFNMLNVPIGAEIIFTLEETKKAKVIDNRMVSYNDIPLMSLTKLTNSFLNFKVSVAPLPYWTYNGRNLSDIYDEVNPIENQ